jgi:hypothetical protein
MIGEEKEMMQALCLKSPYRASDCAHGDKYLHEGSMAILQ